jgi:hypothetical protein
MIWRNRKYNPNNRVNVMSKWAIYAVGSFGICWVINELTAVPEKQYALEFDTYAAACDYQAKHWPLSEVDSHVVQIQGVN